MEWVAAAAGIGRAFFGIGGAKKQREIDKRQTELSYLDNLEKIRRRSFEIGQVKGTAKAYSESAGVLHIGGSTAQGFLDTMTTEFQKELDWMKSFAEEARKLGLETANVSYRTNILNALSGGLGTASTVVGLGK